MLSYPRAYRERPRAARRLFHVEQLSAGPAGLISLWKRRCVPGPVTVHRDERGGSSGWSVPRGTLERVISLDGTTRRVPGTGPDSAPRSAGAVRLNVPRGTLLPAPSASGGFQRERGSLKRASNGREPEAKCSTWNTLIEIAIGERRSHGNLNPSGSGISRSHEEDASQRIRQGDWLPPFPSGNLQNPRQILGPNPQDHILCRHMR